jgi:protocatechuate 3,4-dioxygenase beta subunit
MTFLLSLLPLLLLVQAGSVQGIVTRSGSTEPLSKATVELRPESNDNAILNSITTDEDGRFIFQPVSPGRYRLTVRRAGYSRPPMSITVVAGQPFAPVQLPMSQTAAISGTVFDKDGQPAGNLVVQALKATYPQGVRVLTPVQTAFTNDLGEYRLFWLSPGRYYVRATAREAEPSNLAMVRGGNFGFSLGVGGGNPQRFMSNGEPDPAIAHDNLPEPIVLPTGPDRYVPIYFSGTADDEIATPIDLRAGSDYTGVNVVLTPTRERHVRGVVIDGVTGKPAQYASLNSVDNTFRSIGGPRTEPQIDRETATFDLPMLPGPHTLSVQSASGSGSIDVRVGDSDINNVTILVMPSFDIPGTIRVEGKTGVDLGMLRMNLVRAGRTLQREERLTYSTALPDGSFVLSAGLGDFRVDISPFLNIGQRFPVQLPPALQNAYVKSIRLGNIDVLNNGLHLEKKPEERVEVVLGMNPGIVEGTAGAADVSVVLVPNVRQRTDLYRVATTDPAGRFRFDKMPPGDYKIFAWAEVETDAWYDTEFMKTYENRGAALTVREGATQRVDVMPNP